MAGSINKVIIVGHVGKDPDIRTFQDGGKIANFSVATSQSWKDKNSGERKERTEWHNISIKSDGLVKVIEQYVKKGDQVGIEGELQTRKWKDQSGNDRYTTEIVVTGFNGAFHMLGSKRDGDSGGSRDQEDRGSRSSNNSGGSSQQSSGGGGGFGRSDLDDEIPFAPEWR